MNENINATIDAALSSVGITDTPFGYESAVTAVQRALTEREYAITEAILAKVAEYDLSPSDDALAARILADAGLASRPAPEPEPAVHEGAEPLSVEDRLVMVETTMQGLADSVTRLAALAQRLAPGSAE